MKTTLVIVTHNRLDYTRKCVENVLADDDSDFELHLWDNASTDGTREYLKSLRGAKIAGVTLADSNCGPTLALNRIWSQARSELVAKVDNDCLITRGWLTTLAKAHRDVARLGAVACWHYPLMEFEERVTRYKLRSIGGHQIFVHPFVCGSGFAMKRSTYCEVGPIAEGSRSIGLTRYFLRLTAQGYVNGWYYPLILQEHMDDPLSPHCCYRDDESLRRMKEVTYLLRERKLDSMEQVLRRRTVDLENILYGSPDVRLYSGWRNRLRQLRGFNVFWWRLRRHRWSQWDGSNRVFRQRGATPGATARP